MVVFPAILQPTVRQITGSDDFAVGHFGSVGYYVSAKIGKLFGNKTKSTEDIQVPKSLGFLRDTSVAISLTMSVFFVIVALLLALPILRHNYQLAQILLFSLLCKRLHLQRVFILF